MTEQFGPMLRRLRLRAGLKQPELAEASGVSERQIRRYETGQATNPGVETVRMLADGLNLVSPERDAFLAAASGIDGARPERDALADAADQLAQAVGARWRREEEQRQVQDPFPLPVRWRTAPKRLTDHWANIRRTEPGSPAGALDLAGDLGTILRTYRRIPSGRLVVLGRPGSGKTALAVRFVLDHLAERTGDQPVPVIVGLGSWNPVAVPLRDWLAGQLARDHPGLAATTGPDRSTLAAALVDSNRILPVLDGFDEIASGLHPAALRELNASTLPLLLTSREAEYAAAVAETDVLTAAAGVELTDLTVDDLAAYLPRTARGNPENGGTAWDSVLAAPRKDKEPAARNLAEVLTTPLMTTLARTVYSDVPGRDPAELLDIDRFPTARAVEEHLLGSFLPTAYRHPRGDERDPDRAVRWLRHLATHLERVGSTDLLWWQLGDSLRRGLRMLVIGVLAAIGIGLVAWLVDGLAAGLMLGGQGIHLWLEYLAVDAIAVGCAAGLAFAVGYGLMTRFRPGTLVPSRVRIRFPRRFRRSGFGSRFAIGLVAGVAYGLVFGLVLGLIEWLAFGQVGAVVSGLVDSLLWGLAFGPAAGISVGLGTWFEAPVDIRSAARPGDLLRATRRTTIGQIVIFGPLFGLVVAFAGEPVTDLLRAPGEAAELGPAHRPRLGPDRRRRRRARLSAEHDHVGTVAGVRAAVAAADRPAPVGRAVLSGRCLSPRRAPADRRRLPVPACAPSGPPHAIRVAGHGNGGRSCWQTVPAGGSAPVRK